MRKKVVQTLFLLILVTLLASCALPQETAAPTVDTDAIVATVAARWETQQVLVDDATATPTAGTTDAPAAEPGPAAEAAPDGEARS